jgi:hypothetical protein
MVKNNYSEFWKNLPWRKLRKNLFRLQCRLFKAVREGDKRRVKRHPFFQLKIDTINLKGINPILT